MRDGHGIGRRGYYLPQSNVYRGRNYLYCYGLQRRQQLLGGNLLTQKTGIGDETGLGENGTAPGTTCTDNPGGSNPATPCEIGVGASVGLTSSIPISDVLIGSVQSGF